MRDDPNDIGEKVLETDRSRLIKALDSLPVSFAVWDKDLNFVDCNEQFHQLHSDIAHLFVIGTPFEDVVRARAYSGRQTKAKGREEEWIENRIKAMKSGPEEYEFFINEEWYHVVQTRLDNGDIVNYQKNITVEKERELELAERENLYRTLFEFCPDAVYIHDGETMLFANPASVKLFGGKTIDEVVGQSAFKHTPPEYEKTVRKRIQGILDSGITAERTEQEYVCFDGTYVEIEAQGTRISFDGKPAVLVIARDISARKQNQKQLREAHDNLEIMVEERTRKLTQEIEERRFVEDALRESEARFRDIAEAASEWIWEMDADLRFTYMSERACETYGWNTGLPIGRSRIELVDQGEWTIDRAALEDHEEIMHRHEVFHNVEFSVITKDGRKFFTQINGKPIIDENGDFSGYRGTASNITDKKIIEIALKESEEIARVLLNSPSDPAILVDVDGIVLDANEAVLKRYDVSRDKIIGENIFNIMMIRDAFDLDSIESRRDNLRQVVRERTPKTVIDKVGDRWFEANLYPILDERGGVARLAIYTKDITQQKQIELALRKAKDGADLANRSKSEFLANMSHELRSPLTAILGFSEAMQQEIFGPFENPKYKEYLENIHKSGSHLHQLINDILDVSAIEAGHLDIATQEIVVADLVMSSVRMVNPRAEEVGLEIEQNVPSDLPNIKGDERRLKQVLVNLLANAVKFTPEKGIIEVSACLTEDGLLLQVSDNGIGMDDQGVKEAITKFGQVESDLSRRYDGTGLGLPLSIGIIEIHDGKLTIESELGVGTTVSISLPKSRIIQI